MNRPQVTVGAKLPLRPMHAGFDPRYLHIKRRVH